MSDLKLKELEDSGTYVILPSEAEDRVLVQIPNYLLPVADVDFGGADEETRTQGWFSARLTITIPLHENTLMFGMMGVEIFIPETGLHARIRSPQKLDQLKSDLALQIVSTVRRRLAITGGKPSVRSEQELIANKLLLETAEPEVDDALRLAVQVFLKKHHGRFEEAVLTGLFVMKALREFENQT